MADDNGTGITCRELAVRGNDECSADRDGVFISCGIFEAVG
jgi:hypothetical protein